MVRMPAFERHAGREAIMEELSTRQKTLLRVGLLVAILITLWMFGAVRLVGPVAYAPVAH